MSSNEPFRLVFKRGQVRDGKKPVFKLHVSAEMTPEFERAAHEYGLWNEVIYADPKLDESRALLFEKNKEKQKRRVRRADSFISMMDGPTALFLFPFYLVWKFYKLMFTLPVKLIWWLFKSVRSQDKQIMRFSELLAGKTISTRSLPEIVEAEEIILKTTNEIKTHVLVAMNFSSEAFDATQTV